MDEFNFINIKSHIRVLAARESFILAGVGSFLFVWIRSECSGFFFARSIEVLPEDVIGIRFDTGTRSEGHSIPMMVYSIRFILRCSIQYEPGMESNFKLVRHHQINVVNMVMDLVCHPTRTLILNSRNEVIFLDQNQIKQHIVGPKKCILYSGRFLDTKTDFVIVASGTVFKQILIWALPFQSEHLQPVYIQTLHGHEGVIFDIEFHRRLNVLLTVSDDRSIRVWNGSEVMENYTFETWLRNQFSLAQIYYGHEARIWKVRATMFDKLPVCVSVGEDSNVIMWTLSEPFRMVRKRTLFRNNRIWSLEITETQEIICGGSDGSVLVFPLQDMLQHGPFQPSREKFELSSSLKALLYGKTKSKFITLTSCLRGRFFMVDDQPQEKCFKPELSQIFDDYIKMAGNHQRTWFALGSKHGHIAILNHSLDLVCMEKIFDQKILDVSFVDEDRFLVCLLSGVMKIFRISGSKLEPLFGHDFILPHCRHQWSSCAMLSETGLLVVGDYSGNISAYQTDSSDPFVKLRSVHGNNGVTCIRKRFKSSFVYSSGRNGKIIEYFIKRDAPDLIKLRTFAFFSDMEWVGGLEFDHQQSPRFAYGFESRRFLVWDLNRSLVLFEEDCGGGHRSWDVVIDQEKIHFSYSHKNDLVRISRRWTSDYQLLDYPSLPRKINCCSCLFECSDAVDEYLMVGGEDTSIQVLKYAKNTHRFSLELSLCGHISSVASIKCLRLFEADTAADQHHQFEAYAVSVGGRSQLILWKFWLDDYDPSHRLVCQEMCNNFLGLFNEQMEFEENIRKTNDLVKLDVRYMDVDLIRRSPTGNAVELIIMVACSDAAFRIFYYHESDPKIVTLKKIACPQSSCILRTRILPPVPSLVSAERICPMANNRGTVNLWCWNFDADPAANIEGRLALSIQIHQSGINAIDLVFLTQNPELILMATGGDDNALSLTLIRVTVVDPSSAGSLKLELLKRFQDLATHTCQITDLRFWWENGRPVLTSVAIDQQLVRWPITDVAVADDHANQQWRPLANDQLPMIDRLSIADISSMCPVFDERGPRHRTRILAWMICGEGFQFVQSRLLSCEHDK